MTDRESLTPPCTRPMTKEPETIDDYGGIESRQNSMEASSSLPKEGIRGIALYG